MTSVAGPAHQTQPHEISIPVQKVVQSEVSKHYETTSNTTSSSSTTTDPGASDKVNSHTKDPQAGGGISNGSSTIDKRMKEMEEEMDRVRLGVERSVKEVSKDTDNSKTVSTELLDADDPRHQHLKTTKISRSYEKTTKVTEEKRGQSQDGSKVSFKVPVHDDPGEEVRVQPPTQSVKLINVEDVGGNGDDNHKEITTTIYESPTVTIKTVSREGTPQRQRRVVVVKEEDPGDNIRERITISPHRQRIIVSPGRDRITISPASGHTVSTTTTTFDGESPRKEVKKISSYCTTSKKTTTTTSSKSSSSTSNNNTKTTTGDDIHVIVGNGENTVDPLANGRSNPFESDPFFAPAKSQVTTATVNDDAGSVFTGPARFDWDGWMDKQRASKSPAVEFDSHGGRKRMRLRYDISPRDYDASDIVVKVKGDTEEGGEHKVVVRAEHKETGPNRSVWRECSKEFLIPRGVDLGTITSAFDTDQGVLTIDIPLPLRD